MKKTLTILMLFIALFTLNSCFGEPEEKDIITFDNVDNSEMLSNDLENGETYYIEINENGFVPSTLNVKAGDEVIFINNDTLPHWPASATHPTHEDYPGSSIEKCGTSEENEIFDSCKGLTFEEEFSFTFNEKGTWNYHDHLNIDFTGTIVVE